MAENDRRFSCLAYECFVLLDTICDSYERRVSGDPPTISRFMRDVPQFRDLPLGWSTSVMEPLRSFHIQCDKGHS